MRDCPTGVADVEGPRGYLLGGLTAMGQYVSGTEHCPWVVKVRPGQKIRVVLFHFAVWRNPKVCFPHTLVIS